MNATLSKSQPWHNPFILTSKTLDVEINHICFYKDGKVIANTRWFTSDNKFSLIELPFDVKRSTKLNLDRKDAFTIKSKDSWSSEYDLYIHADLMPSLKSLGRVDGIKDWYHTATYENFEITLHGIKDGESEVKDHTLCFECNYESTDTEEWIRCKKICADMKETCGADITEYRMHEILQHYNISKKRK